MNTTHRIGVSSFAYSFACGNRPAFRPEHAMTPFELIDRAALIGADIIQIADNMPLEIYNDAELDQIRIYSSEKKIALEIGMRGATEERLSEYIRISNRLGAQVLRVITDGAGFAPAIEDCCRIFSDMTSMLTVSGVVIGIENHDRFTAREYAQMVEIIGHPNVGLTIDTLNSLSHEESVDEVIRYMAPYCVCMHIKDYDIKRINGGGGLKITGADLGTGRLDIRRCYEECSSRSDYDFNLILESWMEPCDTLEETLMQEEEWAASGLGYLKNMIQTD